MKSTQPCQACIPWVGELSLRSFVQFSPHLFFTVITKNCLALSVYSDCWASCPQDADSVHSASALLRLSRAPRPAAGLLTLSSDFCCPGAYSQRAQHFVPCQQEVYSTMVHTQPAAARGLVQAIT